MEISPVPNRIIFAKLWEQETRKKETLILKFSTVEVVKEVPKPNPFDITVTKETSDKFQNLVYKLIQEIDKEKEKKRKEF